MRLRIAEVGEHAVAHISGHYSMMLGDYLGDAAVIEHDHLAHVFRIKPRRKRSRADQIAKHHRDVASLSIVLRRSLDCLRLADGWRLQFGDRPQHLAAMPEQHTELFEIILGQISDNGKIDRILGKAASILSEVK